MQAPRAEVQRVLAFFVSIAFKKRTIPAAIATWANATGIVVCCVSFVADGSEVITYAGREP